jgi:hypothetical protein
MQKMKLLNPCLSASAERIISQGKMVMEGLVNLRPRRLQALLEDAGSIKVKRLFRF